MSERPITTTEPPWYTGPAFLLLVSLMLVYVVGTFLGTRGNGAHLVNLLLTAGLILAVKKITRSRRALRVTTILAVLVFIGNTYAHEFVPRDTYVWDSASSLAFFVVILIFLAVAVVKADRVNADTVFAASCVFMLMGIAWAYAYTLLHIQDPTSFSLNAHDMEHFGPALLHFSFTTLTTVGYGSISPMSQAARTLSDLQAVIAQLYLAVVVARLVSLQIEHSRKG